MTNSPFPAPFPRASKLFAYLFLFVSALSVFTNAFYLQQLDFISFWAAAVLALQGKAAAVYDVEAHKAIQDGLTHFDSLMPFAYPPPFLLLVLPVGLLPYKVAAGAWIVGTYGLYFLAARKLLPRSGWLVAAFPPVLLNGIVGQNGFVTGALFVAAALALPRRPFVAGLLLGCLVIKPQLGVLIPIALVAGRQWKAFAGAALSVLALLLAALILFGPETYLAFPKAMPLFASIASDGLVGWHKMASVYAALRLAGLPAQAAWACHILVALAAAAATAIAWARPFDISAKCALLIAASALVSPYIYVYDAVMLIVPFLWLAARKPPSAILIGLWLVPLITIGQSWGLNETVNLMPLVPIGLTLLLCRELFAENARAARQRASFQMG